MLAHDRTGTGPPLVLIHGLGSHRQVWSPLLDRLSHDHDVITLDLPGFGDSPMWPTPEPGTTGAGPGGPGAVGTGAGPHAVGTGAAGPGGPGLVGASTGTPGSVDHLAGLVAEFLAELGLERPAVAGNSLGGIALELGRRGRASAVTAFAPVGFWRPAGLRWCRTVVGAARFATTALAPALPALLRTGAGRAALCSVFYARPARVPAADCLAGARALAAAPGFAAARAALGSWPPPTPRSPASADDGDDRGDSPSGRGRDLSTGGRGGRGHAPAGGQNEGVPDDAAGGAAGAFFADLTTIPVTVAWGSRDAVLPRRAQARRARAVLPAARHITLRGCGHLPFADDPERCAGLLTLRQ